MKISQDYFHNMLILLENIFRVANNLPSRVNYTTWKVIEENRGIVEAKGVKYEEGK